MHRSEAPNGFLARNTRPHQMSSSRCCKATCAASCWGPDSAPVAPGPHEAAGPEAEAAPTGDSSAGILRPWAEADPRGSQNTQTLSGGAEVCRRSRGQLTGGQNLASERPQKSRGALTAATVGSVGCARRTCHLTPDQPVNPYRCPTQRQTPQQGCRTGQQRPGHSRPKAEGKRGKEHVDVEVSDPDSILDIKSWRDTPKSSHPASFVLNWGN